MDWPPIRGLFDALPDIIASSLKESRDSTFRKPTAAESLRVAA